MCNKTYLNRPFWLLPGMLFSLCVTFPAAFAVELSSSEHSLADHVSARSLEGHLSFLASDLLNGRDTPSAGLDIASEYIAAQYRRAGLKPLPDGGYFQIAELALIEQKMELFSISLENGKQITRAIRFDVQIIGSGSLTVTNTPVYRANSFANLEASAVEGKALLVTVPEAEGSEQEKLGALFRVVREARSALKKLKPAALVVLIPIPLPPRPERTVVDAEIAAPEEMPIVFLSNADWKASTAALPEGQTQAALNLSIPAPQRTAAKARNVIGILPGSDPVLKNTYVLVTSHYDHLGVSRTPGPDVIFNGANDDGSGTVSVIEIASALAGGEPRPKRSIVFITYFGEEKGLLGSRYYGRHPAVPLKETVADINLEQVGRTDESGGPQTNSASITGFDFSDVTNYFVAAGEKTGVRVYQHPKNSDLFFGRSDNQALADAGIPAHTLCTSFEFADYHKVSDEWNKIDYANMEKVDRMAAVAIWDLANSEKAPQWNAANPKTAKYVEAGKKLNAP